MNVPVHGVRYEHVGALETVHAVSGDCAVFDMAEMDLSVLVDSTIAVDPAWRMALSLAYAERVNVYPVG